MTKYILSILLGAVIAWASTFTYYKTKIAKSELASIAAITKVEKEYANKAEEWRIKLDEADNVGSTPTIERVYVKTGCVPSTGDSSVADGGSSTGAILAEANTRSLERVIKTKEEQYRQCSYRLRALQEMLAK